MNIYDPAVINDYAIVPALAAGALSIACLLTYIIGSKGAWKRSLLGVAFAGIFLPALAVLGIVFGRRLGGLYPGYEWVALGVYSLVAGLYLVMLVTIVRTQRHGNRDIAAATPIRKQAPMSKTPKTTARIVDGEPTTVDPKTGEPTLAPTSKVLAGAITGGALVVGAAMLAAITPDLLTGLGPWGIVVYAGIVALGGVVAGYVKRP